jgi:hypothetical protein
MPRAVASLMPMAPASARERPPVEISRKDAGGPGKKDG